MPTIIPYFQLSQKVTMEMGQDTMTTKALISVLCMATALTIITNPMETKMLLMKHITHPIMKLQHKNWMKMI